LFAISLAKKVFGKARYEWEEFRKIAVKDVNWIELVQTKVSVVSCKLVINLWFL
jgi:hypothetical protein